MLVDSKGQTAKSSVLRVQCRLFDLLLVFHGDTGDESEDPDTKPAKRYFSGDDDVGWRQLAATKQSKCDHA